MEVYTLYMYVNMKKRKNNKPIHTLTYIVYIVPVYMYMNIHVHVYTCMCIHVHVIDIPWSTAKRGIYSVYMYTCIQLYTCL